MSAWTEGSQRDATLAALPVGLKVAGRVGVGSRDCTAGCPSDGRALAGERPPALPPLAGCVTVQPRRTE